MHEFGGPEVLRYESVPSPAPGANQVLIEVRAVSVNRTLDCVVRAGRYRIKPTFPHVLGTDPAGIVSAVGDGVSNVRVGDRVSTTSIVACGQCAACQALDPAHSRGTPLPNQGGRGSDCSAPNMLGVSIWGAYAEYVCLPSRNVTPVQADVSLAEASVISRHYSAAFHFVDGLAELQPGEWVLVMGAAGALGSALVQVAKLGAATVIAAAGTEERVAACVANGADFGVNYRAQDLAAEVLRITSGRGVDVVMENIGDPVLWKGAMNSLARNGRLVTGGSHGGGIVEIDVNRLYGYHLRIIGGTSGPREYLDRAWKAAGAGQLHPVIGTVLPLSEAAEAHRIAEAGEVIGKVMLAPARRGLKKPAPSHHRFASGSQLIRGRV